MKRSALFTMFLIFTSSCVDSVDVPAQPSAVDQNTGDYELYPGVWLTSENGAIAWHMSGFEAHAWFHEGLMNGLREANDPDAIAAYQAVIERVDATMAEMPQSKSSGAITTELSNYLPPPCIDPTFTSNNGESVYLIPDTCTYCGDGSCNGGETCSSCSSDCGVCPPTTYCGDGVCNGGETCSSCSTDCGTCNDPCLPTATGQDGGEYKRPPCMAI